MQHTHSLNKLFAVLVVLSMLLAPLQTAQAQSVAPQPIFGNTPTGWVGHLSNWWATLFQPKFHISDVTPEHTTAQALLQASAYPDQQRAVGPFGIATDSRSIQAGGNVVLLDWMDETDSTGTLPQMFASNTVAYNYQGGPVILYSMNPFDPATLCTDDKVVIRITHPDGSQAPIYFHEYNRPGPGITCTGPVDLTNRFEVGINQIYIEVWDLIPPKRSTHGYQIGLGAGDLVPPTIKVIQLYGTKIQGKSGLSVSLLARITDIGSGVDPSSLFVTISEGRVVQQLQPYVTAYHGSDVYSAVFEDVPENKAVVIDITAADNAGNVATLQARGYFSNGQFFGSYTCLKPTTRFVSPGMCYAPGSGYTGQIGNPVSTVDGQKWETWQVPLAEGPGEADIDISLTYNSPSVRLGLFGAAITSDLETRLVPLYNPLVPGVEIVSPEGTRLRFVDNGNGTFTPASPANKDVLRKEGDNYLWITYDQRYYRFDAAGLLIARLDRNGNAVTYTYSGKRLSTISTGGRTVSVAYNAAGYISSLTIGSKVVRFTYDGDQLVRIQNPAGGEWKMEYEVRDVGEIIDERGQDFAYHARNYFLRKVTTPAGRVKNEQTYDAKGRVDHQVSSSVGELHFAYLEQPDGSLQTVITDAYGKPEIHLHNALGQLVSHTDRNGNTETYTYTADFFVASHTNLDGVLWTYQRDDRGNITEIYGPLGFHETWRYNAFNQPEYFKDADGFEWRWEYDLRGNLTKTIQADQAYSRIIYDSRGLPVDQYDFNNNHVHNEYDPITGDLLFTTDGEGSRTAFTYDLYGRQITILRPLGGLWVNTYDLNDNLTAVDGPHGYHASFSYDPDGLLEVQVDADNSRTVNVYDQRGRLIEAHNGENETLYYTYGAMNELKTFKNARGAVTTYLYDAELRPIQVNQPYRVTYKFTYDALGHVLFATDPLGRVTASTYDDLGRPYASVQNYIEGGPINADTNVVTRYTYDLRGNTVGVRNALGNWQEFGFDALGRMIWAENEEDERTRYEYDNNSNQTVVRFPEGNYQQITYNGRNQPKFLRDGEGFITEMRYDPDGNVQQVIAPNGIVRYYEYNLLDQAISVTDNFLFSVAPSSDVNVTTYFTYSLEGDLLKMVNAENYVFTYSYNLAHRRILEINSEGEIRYTYDDSGNLITLLDADQQRWQYQYDLLERLEKTSNPESEDTQYGYDLAGNLISVTDPKGNVTSYTADALNRPVNMRDALSYRWVYTYNAIGDLLSVQDGNGQVTRYTYDRVGRTLSRIDAMGYRQEYAYDENGRLVEKRIPFADPAKTIVERFTFDGRDLMTSLTNGEGEITRFSFNNVGQLETRTDNDGVVTRYGYDALRRLNQVVLNSLVGAPAVGDVNVAYTYRYDRVGNLAGIIDPLGHETTFRYNGLHSLVYERNAVDSEWFYQYDPAQNLIQRTDANRQVTRYVYYPDHQLRLTDYPDDPDVVLTYDANNNPVSMKDGLGTTTWRYDALNRLVGVTDSLGRNVDYTYDAVNRLSVKYPDRRTVSFQYLSNDWLWKMTDPKSGVSIYTHDEAGRTVSLAYPNNTYSTRSFDRASRLLEIGNYQKGGDVLSAFRYEYDKVGQRIQVANTYGWRNPATVTETYTYDALRRLVGVSDTQGMYAQYAYDRASNRTLWQTNDDPFGQSPQDGFTSTSTFDAANRLLSTRVERKPASQSETITYRYDPNGNRIDKLVAGNGVNQGMAYGYDDENRLISAYSYLVSGKNTTWKDETRMGYDGSGRRLVETYDPHAANRGGLKRTEYTFDGLDPISEFDLWNKQQRNYYRGEGNELIQMHDFPAGMLGQQYWYHNNGRGSIAGITKDKGQSVHTYRYDSFGGVTPDNGNWTAPHNAYTYTEKALNNQTGLSYFGVRYYDSKAGVWLTPDTYRGDLANPLSLHSYMHNYQNPINYIDQDGRLALLVTAALGTAVGAVTGAVGAYTAQVVSNISEGGLTKDAFTNVSWDTVKAGAIIGGSIGLTIGTVGAMAPAAMAWASTVGFNAEMLAIGAGISGGTATTIGTATSVTAGVGIIGGTTAAIGGSACSINPYFSEATRSTCADVALVGMTAYSGSYALGEEIVSIGGWKGVTYRGQTIYQRSDINWDYVDPKTGLTNRQLARLGRSPIGADGKPIALHHYDQTPNGPLVEMESSFHTTNYCDLHTNTGQLESNINRSQFNSFREGYWKSR